MPGSRSFAASGAAEIPVHGVALQPHEFGLRSRYLQSARVVGDADGLIAVLREAGERPVLFPERDENVDWCWTAGTRSASSPT